MIKHLKVPEIEAQNAKDFLDSIGALNTDFLPFKKNGSWPVINENQISDILTSFESQEGESTPVYVTGGKVYTQNSDGLSTFDHPITDPYTWPIGHNVRPATMY